MKGHVRKLKNTKAETWEIALYKGKDANGKKQYIREYAHSEDAADLRCAVLVQEIMEGRHVNHSKLTLGEYLDSWLIHYKTAARSAKTYGQAEWASKHILPDLAPIPLQKLSPMDVQKWIDGKIEAGYAAKSVKDMRDILRNALNQAIEWELLRKSPLHGVHLPKLRRKPPKVWTKEQLEQFFETARNHRLYAAFYLAAKTGLREGEIVQLKWDSVNLDRGVVYVQEHTKTDSSLRPMPLSEKTVEVLRGHQQRQNEEKAILGSLYADRGYLFTSPKRYGQPLKVDSLYKTFTRVTNRAGVSHLAFHGLRHTFATLLLQAGVHPKIVAELLGHSEVRTTLDTYSHVLPVIEKQAVTVLDSII